MKRIKSLAIAFAVLLLTSCGPKSSFKTPIKVHPGDPFTKAMPQGQFFELSADRDTVIMTTDGVKIVFPRQSVQDEKGQKVKGPIKVEVAEALSPQSLVRANLVGASQTAIHSAMYLNVTTPEGKQLSIDPNQPLYIELPKTSDAGNVKIAKGERDEKGNTVWEAEKEPEKFLISVELDDLDFLPEGFYDAVSEGLPFNSHTYNSQQLSDSLYYSLSASGFWNRGQTNFVNTFLNEAFNNIHKETSNGKYTSKSFEHPREDHGHHRDIAMPCGIDPASVKVLKEGKFEGTLIATREFEERMRHIHRSCSQEIMELYVNNLDKNLYEIDLMASKMESKAIEYFKQAASQRLGKVQNSNPNAKILAAFYKRKLEATKEKLQKAQDNYKASLDKQNEKAQRLVEEYKEVLWEREKYRMKTTGFEWSGTGWLGVISEEKPGERIQAMVLNGKDFDRVYTYVVYQDINSILRMNSDDNVNFMVGEPGGDFLHFKSGNGLLVAVGYKGEEVSMGKMGFSLGSQKGLSLTLSPSSQEELKKLLPDKSASRENKIALDLKYQAKLYAEKKRQEALMRESAFMRDLYDITQSCCQGEINGKQLFWANCASCHSNGGGEATGPSLCGVRNRHSLEWIVKFTQNSQLMIASGDPEAISEYNGVLMNAFPQLSRREIIAILDYIEGNCIYTKN